MSLREFAVHLGVSDRMVSKWEAGGEGIHPRPVNQAALDTSLARSDLDVQERFRLLLVHDGVMPGASERRLDAECDSSLSGLDKCCPLARPDRG